MEEKLQQQWQKKNKVGTKYQEIIRDLVGLVLERKGLEYREIPQTKCLIKEKIFTKFEAKEFIYHVIEEEYQVKLSEKKIEKINKTGLKLENWARWIEKRKIDKIELEEINNLNSEL